MTSRSPYSRYVAAVTVLMAMCAQSQGPDKRRSHRVNDTFDGNPFEYTMERLREAPGHTVFSVTYPSPIQSDVVENNTVPGEIYLPKPGGGVPRPAVICLHILNGDFVLVRLLCSVLADNGIPAMMFKLPYYGERCPPGKRSVMLADPAMLGNTISQGLQDVRRAVDLLQARPEVDASLIGISGISLGAVVGATACGIEPRLQRGCFILGGANVPAILRHARETRRLQEAMDALSAEKREPILRVLREVDPMAYAGRLGEMGKEGRIMMINAADDEVMPKACTETLAEIAGISDDVIWLPGVGHYTAMAALPRIIAQTVQFFGRDLPEEARIPIRDPVTTTPFEALVGFMGQIGTVLGMPPGVGLCHYMDLAIEASLGGGKSKDFDITIIRGSNGRFVFRGNVPEIGRTELGVGEYPWMAAKDGTIFVGIQPDGERATPVEYLDERVLLRIRVLAGMLAGISLAPTAFESYADVRAEETSEGRLLSYEIKHPGLKGHGSLLLLPDGGTPKHLIFAGAGLKLDIEFKQWHINTVAAPELFREPGGKHAKKVPAEDLCRMFAAVFNFAAEKAQ